EKRVFLVILFTSFSGSLVSRISGAVQKFKIIIEKGIAGGDFEDVFEVDDDATPEEIHDGA
ncbi:hypothetical protein C9Y90_21630, partial [Escherichia coli]